MFGTWGAGLKAAGIPTGILTPEDVLASIDELALRLDHTPTFREAAAEGISTHLAQKFFGSWNKAVIAAGWTPRQMRHHRSAAEHVSRDQRAAALRRGDSLEFDGVNVRQNHAAKMPAATTA